MIKSHHSNHILLPPAVCSFSVCPDKRQHRLYQTKPEPKTEGGSWQRYILPSLPTPVSLLGSLWLAGVTLGRRNYLFLFYRVTYLASLPTAGYFCWCLHREESHSVTEQRLQVPYTRQAGLALPPATKFQAMIPPFQMILLATKIQIYVCFCRAWLAFDWYYHLIAKNTGRKQAAFSFWALIFSVI